MRQPDRRSPHSRPTIHHSLLDALSEMIVRLELPPGSHIDEAALCREFEISRTPLREALKVLASDGLLTSQPQRGSDVTPITSDEIDALFPVIGALKACAAELACDKFKKRDLDRFDGHASAATRFAKSNDHDSYFDIYVDSHDRVLAAANNPVLARQIRPLWVHARRFQRLAPMSEMCWTCAIANHECIASAARDRSVDKLAQAMRQQSGDQHRTTSAWFASQAI